MVRMDCLEGAEAGCKSAAGQGKIKYGRCKINLFYSIIFPLTLFLSWASLKKRLLEYSLRLSLIIF